jgi:magnesium-transporting ATPase (P-type)
VTYLEATNILFMGCTVVEGEGVGIVVATGKDNQVQPSTATVIYRSLIVFSYL